MSLLCAFVIFVRGKFPTRSFPTRGNANLPIGKKRSISFALHNFQATSGPRHAQSLFPKKELAILTTNLALMVGPCRNALPPNTS